MDQEQKLNQIKDSVRDVLRPMIGRHVGPSLADRVCEALGPTMERIARRNFDRIQDQVTVTENPDRPGVLDVKFGSEFMKGLDAGMLRALGMEIPEDVPDCAVYDGDSFNWVSLDFNLHPDGTITNNKSKES